MIPGKKIHQYIALLRNSAENEVTKFKTWSKL